MALAAVMPHPERLRLDIGSAVLAWFDRFGRKDLPWQRDINPYRVWISEIMLQQTQVATVIPYYARFLQRFPDVESLAAASEDEVLHLWTGLGYYSRARNLQRAARLIVEQHGGKMPDTVETLTTLPGVGRSTAGAIAAIACGRHAAILDGNVKRVLARFHAVPGHAAEGATLNTLWAYAEAHTPARRTAEYTQAIMDLGATLCTRTRPACAICPLEHDCAARREGDPAAYPGRQPKKTLPVKSVQMLLLESGEEILLEKRPPTGVWAGLWTFPQIETGADPIAHCRDQLQLKVALVERWASWRHTFSHYHLQIEPLRLRLLGGDRLLREPGRQRWYHRRKPDAVGLAAPVTQLLQRLD